MSMQNNIQTESKGFTLLELLISLSVFSVVSFVLVVSTLSVVHAGRRSEESIVAMDNLHFALEDMIRTLRFGGAYHCGTSGVVTAPMDCLSGDSTIYFEQYGGDPGLSGDQVVYDLDPSTGQIRKSTDGGATKHSLTSTKLKITSLKFYVRGSSPTDLVQSRVLVSISGETLGLSAGKEFHLQTTVMQGATDK